MLLMNQLQRRKIPVLQFFSRTNIVQAESPGIVDRRVRGRSSRGEGSAMRLGNTVVTKETPKPGRKRLVTNMAKTVLYWCPQS
jgi:hypothetical protein